MRLWWIADPMKSWGVVGMGWVSRHVPQWLMRHSCESTFACKINHWRTTTWFDITLYTKGQNNYCILHVVLSSHKSNQQSSLFLDNYLDETITTWGSSVLQRGKWGQTRNQLSGHFIPNLKNKIQRSIFLYHSQLVEFCLRLHNTKQKCSLHLKIEVGQRLSKCSSTN